MALWHDELEALRPQLRDEAAAFIASTPWREADTAVLPVEERVAAHRASQLGGAPSDRAVDRTIEGPADRSGFARSCTSSQTACSSISMAARGWRGQSR
jgi:hypothetical protein